jgi:hypothetical protein
MSHETHAGMYSIGSSAATFDLEPMRFKYDWRKARTTTLSASLVSFFYFAIPSSRRHL